MRKVVILGSLILALNLFLAGAPAVQAGGGFTGDWSGTWGCHGSGCKAMSGTMTAKLVQKGHEVTGTMTLENTDKGTLSGQFRGQTYDQQGWAMLTIKSPVSAEVTMSLKIDGNSLSGVYKSDVLNGQYNLKRQ